MSIVGRIVGSCGRRRPLSGVRLGLCLHVTRETSVLALAAKTLGAQVALCSANPLSAQDDIAAFLASRGVNVFAWRGETKREYEQCIKDVLDCKPTIVTDDGGDLHAACHRASAKSVIGGTEETTSGVKRLTALQASGRLLYPVIAVNNAKTKHMFDNRYGTGQSVLDGILRATPILFASKRVIVCGYGWVGKGVASRARGLGASVTVTEVEPLRALEAKMDGFSVSRLADAAQFGEVFITCTGQTGVIRKEHFAKMKDGAIVANAGHFDVEIDVGYLRSVCRHPEMPQRGVERFALGRKKIYLLSKGRVVNLVEALGNPPEVMALSFANQLLCIIRIAERHREMEKAVHEVPVEIDNTVASYALDSLGIRIDTMTADQKRYMKSSLG
jgi:adenosylhomocysteinase